MRQFDRFVTVGGQADHLEAGFGVEHGRQGLANSPLVIGDHNSEGRSVAAHVVSRPLRCAVIGHAEPDLPSRPEWTGHKCPADEFRPLAQPLKAVAATSVGQWTRSDAFGTAVVGHRQHDFLGGEGKLHRGRGSGGVLRRIGQCLLSGAA